jgi:predicted nucleic acid-binding protein
MLAVSDTSPVFNLACIGRLDLLRTQFEQIWIPSAVETELIQIPDAAIRARVEHARSSGWLMVRSTTEVDLVKLLTAGLHQGEAEAIALALETKANRLLIDEKEGREMARRLGLSITGVLGVLLRAKRMGQVAEIKPDLLALRDQARFFVSRELETEILKSAGE